MRLLKNTFRTSQAFLDVFDDGPTGPGMFCATTDAIDSGERVLCEIIFPNLPNHVVLKGWVVRWHAAVPRLRVRAGADVLLDVGQSQQIEYLLGVARGTREPGRRRSTRLPVELPVHLQLVGSTETLEASLQEISITGALVRPPRPLEKGAQVILEIRLPDAAAPMQIASVVIEPTDDYTILVFLARDAGGMRRLRELVRRLRAGS